MGHWLWAALGDRPTQNLSIFDPVSPPAFSIRHLTLLVFAITGFIFFVVEGVLFYCIYRFRHRRAAGATEPPQVYGSKPIEIAWTAAPTLIVFILVLVTARTLWEVNRPAPLPRPGDDTLFVTVTGRQWWWEYTYDVFNGQQVGFTTANELHIPASTTGLPRTVYLNLQSADVAHSYWVPRLAGKTDLIPGRVNQTWFRTEQPGLYLGQCAEFCGTQHAGMLLRVYVDTWEDFERWLSNQRKPAPEPADAAGREDRAIFLAQSCVNCHRVRGTSAAGTYAPDLTHLMSRETLAGGTLPNTRKNLQDWVADPQQFKTGCLMPAFGLSARDRQRVVNYLLTLK